MTIIKLFDEEMPINAKKHRKRAIIPPTPSRRKIQ